MKHFFELIIHLVSIINKYLILAVIFMFDGLVFGYPSLLIYKFVLVSKFSFPVLGYEHVVFLIVLLKIIGIVWKSTNVVVEKEIIYRDREE